MNLMACVMIGCRKSDVHLGRMGRENNESSENCKIQEVEEDFIPVANIRSVGLKRSKSTS